MDVGAFEKDLADVEISSEGSVISRSFSARFSDVINIKDFGATGSAQTTTGSIGSGSNKLTVASVIDFAVGQGILVVNAGAGVSGALTATILAINGTSLTLSANAAATVSGQPVKHDETVALQAAANAALRTQRPLFLPAGVYRISSTITIDNASQGQAAWSMFTMTGVAGDWSQTQGTFPPGGSVIDAAYVGTGLNVLNFTGNNRIRLERFALLGYGATTDPKVGYGIVTYFATALLDHLYVAGFADGVWLRNANTSAVTNSYLALCAHAALRVEGSQGLEIRNTLLANSGPAGTTGAGGNITVDLGSQDVLLDTVLVDEGGGASVDIQQADRVTLRNARVFFSAGGYGVRIGSSATNIRLDNVRIERFQPDRIPVNTLIAAGSGHTFSNVSTAPNGGGDIADTSTDPIYENVNGKWKAPFTDASGTPGNATINKASGIVAVAIGAAAVTVTNSLVSTSSIVHCTIQTADVTLTSIKSVVPAAGSFVVTGNANATAATKVAFTVRN